MISTTTTEHLLSVMQVRLHMIDQGIIDPSDTVTDTTRQIVERLKKLPSQEAIEIEYYLQPFHVKYKRILNNDTLGEIWPPDSINK